MKTENKFVGPIISGREKRLVRKWAVIEKISSLLSKVEDDQVPPWGTKWTNEQIFAIRWTITQLVNMVKIMDEETVDAIPVEWIKKYIVDNTKVIDDLKYEVGANPVNYYIYPQQIAKMLTVWWEKENESNI